MNTNETNDIFDPTNPERLELLGMLRDIEVMGVSVELMNTTYTMSELIHVIEENSEASRRLIKLLLEAMDEEHQNVDMGTEN